MAQTESTSRSRFDVQEDRAWQERFWTAQRVSWLVMALVILAALLGLTGKGGPLASATAHSPGGTIHYPRITRWQSDELVSVKLPATVSGEVEVEMSSEFVEAFAIQSIKPQPSKTIAAATGHRFTFDVGGGGGPKLIQFQVQASNPVLNQPMSATIGNSQPARMTVTVLP